MCADHASPFQIPLKERYRVGRRQHARDYLKRRWQRLHRHEQSAQADHRIQAETGSGGIQSDFPITLEGNVRPRRLDLNLGSGGPLIHINRERLSQAKARRVAFFPDLPFAGAPLAACAPPLAFLAAFGFTGSLSAFGFSGSAAVLAGSAQALDAMPDPVGGGLGALEPLHRLYPRQAVPDGHQALGRLGLGLRPSDSVRFRNRSLTFAAPIRAANVSKRAVSREKHDISRSKT